MNRPATGEIELNVVRIGGFAFVAAPYEMFAANGMYIKAHSPFSMTFIVSKANGGFGYMPAKFAYANGGYEPDNTKYAIGTGELLARIRTALRLVIAFKRRSRRS